MDQLKSKFKELDTNCDKIQLLTVLPKSMTIQQIQNEFNTTYHLARTAKNLLDKSGPLSIPASKAGKPISDELKKSVIDYYNDDDVSRIMPGKNDCLTVGTGPSKTKVQKRLMMSSLKESYEGYKTLYKNDESKKIGFSKFALLRPKNCVQPGSSGTHTVCVCTIHQNVKLIIHGIKIESITNKTISHYRDCISHIICSEPTPNCYLLKCEDCPGLDKFREYLKNAFLENDYDDDELLSFSQWVSTDRCNLQSYTQPLNEALDYFIIKLKKLIPHYYISLQQSNFIKQIKLTLNDTEVLVSCDFAENYSFIIQNAAQSFHYNNLQATIHPFVIYYRNIEDELCHYSFIVISDCLHHDTVAVYLFIEKMMKFLKNKLSRLSKIYYVTDGAASQYKNKNNFKNVLKHKDDFGVDCEWHFHATSHGKGPCDGVGGTIKRMASRASLTNEYEGVITSAQELFEWAKTLKTEMEFDFCSNTEYVTKKTELQSRFNDLRTIQGTQGFHAFIPSGGYLKCKRYSNTEEYKQVRL